MTKTTIQSVASTFDLNDLTFFLAVVETGNLSAAARRLDVAQPTVGRRIRHLERSLDARLFNRTPDGHVLTEVGIAVRQAAERIRQSADVIQRRASGGEDDFAAPVRITTTEGFANYWLINKLPVLRDAHPSLRFELLITTRLADMLRLEADIALRIGTPGSEELVGRRVGSLGFGLYASEEYLSENGEPTTTDELAGHGIIESTGVLGGVAQAERLRELDSDATITLGTDSIMTQLQAAKDGLGIAPLAHYLTHHDPTLRRVLKAEFDVQRDLWLLTHQDLKFTARVRATIDTLVAELDRDNALFHGA